MNIKKKNYRRCISCKKSALKEEFWRVVRLTNSYEISLDQGMGRSAYLCPNADCLQQAQRKNLFQRALKVVVPRQIYELLQQRLTTENVLTPSSRPLSQLNFYLKN